MLVRDLNTKHGSNNVEQGRETHQVSPDPPMRHGIDGAGPATEAISRCERHSAIPAHDILPSASRACLLEQAGGLGSAQACAKSSRHIANSQSCEMTPRKNLHMQTSGLQEPWNCHPIDAIPPLIPLTRRPQPLSPPPCSHIAAALDGSCAPIYTSQTASTLTNAGPRSVWH